MSDIQVFQNDQFGLVRTVNRNGDPWFIAADICVAIGLRNTTEALRALDQDERSTEKMKAGTRMQDINIVSESGMYALIMRSNKPEARAFRKWVTSVVLPQIRKTGKFGDMSTDALVERTVNNPDWVIKILNAYKEEKSKRQLAEEQRDDAIKKRHAICEKREAVCIGKLSAKTKECNKLREENCKLKTRLGIEYDEYLGEEFLPIKSIKWVSELFEDSQKGLSFILANRLKRISERLGLKVLRSGNDLEYPVNAIKELHIQILNGDVTSLDKYRRKQS